MPTTKNIRLEIRELEAFEAQLKETKRKEKLAKQEEDKQVTAKYLAQVTAKEPVKDKNFGANAAEISIYNPWQIYTQVFEATETELADKNFNKKTITIMLQNTLQGRAPQHLQDLSWTSEIEFLQKHIYLKKEKIEKEMKNLKFTNLSFTCEFDYTNLDEFDLYMNAKLKYKDATTIKENFSKFINKIEKCILTDDTYMDICEKTLQYAKLNPQNLEKIKISLATIHNVSFWIFENKKIKVRFISCWIYKMLANTILRSMPTNASIHRKWTLQKGVLLTLLYLYTIPWDIFSNIPVHRFWRTETKSRLRGLLEREYQTYNKHNVLSCTICIESVKEKPCITWLTGNPQRDCGNWNENGEGYNNVPCVTCKDQKKLGRILCTHHEYISMLFFSEDVSFAVNQCLNKHFVKQQLTVNDISDYITIHDDGIDFNYNQQVVAETQRKKLQNQIRKAQKQLDTLELQYPLPAKS